MKKLLLITLMLAFGLTGFSQVQFISLGDGDWDNPTIWDQNAVPGAADFVKINNGHYVIIQSSTIAECAIVEVGDVDANGVLTVHGTLNISETTGLSVAVTHANSQLTVNGTLTYTGNVDVNAGLLIVNGTALALLSGEVYNPATGETWMDRNLGASQVATAYNDALAYGDTYQWGRFTEGHESHTSTTTSDNATTAVPNAGNSWDGLFILEASPPYDWLTSQEDALWQGASGTNNPCPTGFRLPTDTEWRAELNSWTTRDAYGAFDSPLKLVIGGYRDRGTGYFNNVDIHGYYWSSTTNGVDVRVLFFGIDEENAAVVNHGRALGHRVRCIKD